MNASIELSSVVFSHGRSPILQDLSMKLTAGQYGVLVGASGSGKSTLLRLIAGLLRPDHGSVFFSGTDQAKVPPHRRDLTMVFQNDALYPHWTIRQTLSQSIRHVRDKQERHERIVEAAKRFEIEEWLDRPPRAVSGGELRRAALANALIGRPSVVLLDEPLSALDGKIRSRMIDVLSKLPRDRGEGLPDTSVLHVTHDGNEAMRLADRVFVLAGGRIVHSDAPWEVHANPLTVSAALALGTPPANCLPCAGLAFPFERLPRPRVTVESDLAVVIRPEAIQIALPVENQGDGWRFEATIAAVHFAGSHAHVRLRRSVPSAEMTASIPWSNVSQLPPIGSAVECFVAIADCRLVADDRSATMGA